MWGGNVYNVDIGIFHYLLVGTVCFAAGRGLLGGNECRDKLFSRVNGGGGCNRCNLVDNVGSAAGSRVDEQVFGECLGDPAGSWESQYEDLGWKCGLHESSYPGCPSEL